MAEFKVGGKCVALDTVTNRIGQGIVKGQVYLVQGISQKTCECAGTYIDLGFRRTVTGRCVGCGQTQYPPITWVDSALLAPLDDLESQESIDELLDRILEAEKEKV